MEDDGFYFEVDLLAKERMEILKVLGRSFPANADLIKKVRDATRVPMLDFDEIEAWREEINREAERQRCTPLDILFDEEGKAGREEKGT